MHIWILKHGEQLPLNSNSRVYRMGMIVQEFIANNHEVLWWTSEYNHATKKSEDKTNINNNNIQFEFLNGVHYSKNISLRRIINHYQIGKILTNEMNSRKEKPDVIIASMPTIDFAHKAVKFGNANNIPVIIDIRDLWPDVFTDLIPISFLKNNPIINAYNKKLRWTLENATAITAITDEYLAWALSKGNLKRNNYLHKSFPIGYPNPGIKTCSFNKDSSFNVVFIGTIGVHFDLKTVLKVAQKLKDTEVKFYIIGDGDQREKLEKDYSLPNVIFTGWLNKDDINDYLSNASVGITPYRNTTNFELNIPNKFYEYMAYGLPILTCLPGPSASLVKENKIGLIYDEGSAMDLEKKLLTLINNKDEFLEMSVNSYDLFNGMYAQNVIYKQYYKFISELLEYKKNEEDCFL